MIKRRLRKLYRRFFPYGRSNPSNADRFAEVYRRRVWATGSSASGEGSERGSPCVMHSVAVLERVVDQFGVRSIADVPCGDFHWFGLFLNDHPEIHYVGYDVVDDVIAENSLQHPSRVFVTLDVTQEAPGKADLVFCKDLVNHLLERDVWSTLANIVASGSKYVLITSNKGSPNSELHLTRPGASRLLDLTLPPYSLPPPIQGDHYLSLWSISQIADHLAGRR